MDEAALDRHRESLHGACAILGTSLEALMETSGGRWYVLRVVHELERATPPADVALAVSTTIEWAANLPSDHRQMAQAVGVAQLLQLRGEPPSV